MHLMAIAKADVKRRQMEKIGQRAKQQESRQTIWVHLNGGLDLLVNYIWFLLTNYNKNYNHITTVL